MSSDLDAPRDKGAPHGAAPGHDTVRIEDLPLEQVAAPRSFLRGFWPTVQDIWAYRELLGQLIRKELKVKYKDSVLGFFWTLLRPLLQLLVYSVAIGVFLGSNRTVPDFGVYLFTGLLAWTLFTDIIGGCTGSIVGNAGLVQKVYFPRELFPLSVIGAALINFVLQSSILIVAYLWTQSWPKVDDLLLVPMALLVVVTFALALGLLLAASNVYLRDMTYLVEVGLLLWFWMTPIVYDWTKVKNTLTCSGTDPAEDFIPNTATCKPSHVDNHLIEAFNAYLANPMANVVLAFQRALWPAGHTDAGSAFFYDGNLYGRLGLIFIVSLALLWLAQRIFARAQGNFAQEL